MSREMKDSGIKWIGDIPKTWRVCRLKDVGVLYGGLIGKSGEDFNVDEEDSSYMLYVPFTNIFNNDSINSKQLYKVKVEQGEKQNLVQKGDLLFLMSSEDYDGIGKPAIMEEQIDNLGLNSFCKGLRVSDSDTNSKYLFYLLSSHILRELVRQEAKGFIRINLRQDRLSCCSIFLPPLAEQQKIADYLDKVCGEIDGVIALQEKMIEELKAYKQSVITKAVTKGLNPNVPMKDSGIDWIGDIPVEWKISLLSSLFVEHKHKNEGLKETNLLSLSYGSIIRKDINTNEGLLPHSFDSYNVIDIGDIVFRLTDLQNDKKSLRTGLCKEKGIITSAYTTIRKKSKQIHSGFMHYLFHSYDICKVFYGLGGGVRQGMNYGDLKKIAVVYPSLQEQRAIADYLDTKCSEIDSLIALKQTKIEELKDYKKSVIYEYVTGKKQVN